VICVDNSEWMRNSDFSPTRWEAQQDAVNLICGNKTRQNLENGVGLISMAGPRVEVQVSLTQDLAKILGALHRIQIGGETDLLNAIQVARLALRHRQNKRQELRIVLFVGSPVESDVKELTRVGAQMKKNKIAVDIVSFGEENAETNEEKLQAFHKAINNHDNSTIITIPPGTSMLSEVLARTAIVRGTEAASSGDAGSGAAGGGQGLDWVDPEIDPELAMAIRLSMESAEQERKKFEDAAKAESGAAAASSGPAAGSSTGGGGLEEDPEFLAAMRASMAGVAQDDADDELAKALALSLETAAADNNKDGETTPLLKEEKAEEMKVEGEVKKEEKEEVVDDAIIEQVLLELPGVDTADPEIQALLASIKQSKEDEKKDSK